MRRRSGGARRDCAGRAPSRCATTRAADASSSRSRPESNWGSRRATVEGLAGASADELRAMEIDGQGLGIHFPKLDADLYVPAVLQGVLGSRRWMETRRGAPASAGQARQAEAERIRSRGADR